MASSEPSSYAEALDAVDGAKQDANRARLVDPGEHFPYKRDAILEHLDAGVDEGDIDADGRPYDPEDHTSNQIIGATEEYIEAQAEHLADTADEGRLAAYHQARDALIAARRKHRRGRRGAYIRANERVEEN